MKARAYVRQAGRRGGAINRRDAIHLAGIAAGGMLFPAEGEAVGLPAVDAAPLPAGVHAVWDIRRAHTDRTETRERVCINGLWRWQPAAERAPAPPAGGWGWFKAPGSWPGITDYLQKDSQTLYPHDSWKQIIMRDISLAWYQREITIPQGWKGRRIALTLEYLNTFATVFIGSKSAGEIRFPAGELDITALCRPGETYLLSILVQASPLKAVMLSYTDTNGAREVKGSVERRGICGDVWLTSTPAGPRITDVKVVTSVTKREITFDVALEGLKHDAPYEVSATVTDAEGTLIKGQGHAVTSESLKNGRVVFTEACEHAKLWDIHTPQNQYDAALTLSSRGNTMDRAHPVRFGFREFEIKGKDFYLNGTRIYLPSVPLDNAQVGAAWATYEGAKETLERFKSMGIYFVYTHNYSCEPGVHLSFNEMLRAADDLGVLIAFAQPHFSNYEWKAPDADDNNGYARHAEFYVRIAQNHPSVVAYAMSHNATGYVEEANPDMIDGIHDPREDWGRRNSLLALRAEAIVKRFDTSRIVYHHSSGNLGSMHTCNFYVNFVPVQELCDWFEHWEKTGVKPVYLCEYGVPCTWDWTMYRGWYKGKREWGSADIPWEFCLAEWDAQFQGDSAYKITDREKANIRWEAGKFKNTTGWHRWDYPTDVGSAAFSDRNAVFSTYVTDNWRAYRARGVSGFGPWEYEMYWSLKGNADRSRKLLPVAWDSLQKPGFSADYIEDRPNNIALGYERSDWLPTAAGTALLRNNMPLLAYIGGGANEGVTAKGHIFTPGASIEKQLVVINNSRQPVECACSWELGVQRGTAKVKISTGEQARIPITLKAPDGSGVHAISAAVNFGREIQKDVFDIHVTEPSSLPRLGARTALFDPAGETRKQLDGTGVRTVGEHDNLNEVDLLIIGARSITPDGPCPDLRRVKSGMNVLMLEQSAETLEKRFGFRIAEYGYRQVFRRIPDHPALEGLDEDSLRDWRGDATLLPPRLKYTIGDRYSPQVKWCGIDVTRVWRCGNRGSVASVAIEKTAGGDFTPIIDCGYGLQYGALMEYREGSGMVLFCQMDVSARTESDPAAERLLANVLHYAETRKPAPRRTAVYAGDGKGRAHLEAAGLTVSDLRAGRIPADIVLIAGPASGKVLSSRKAELNDWLAEGGRLLTVGLTADEANGFLPGTVEMRAGEHIACHFESPANSSVFAGICAADVHNRDPRTLQLVTGGAEILGNGVLARAKEHSVVFCQTEPWQFNTSPMNQKRTFRKLAFLVSRLAGNLGAEFNTKLLKNIATPAAADEKRWLEGLYLDTPEEWDDPYRFFGW